MNVATTMGPAHTDLQQVPATTCPTELQTDLMTLELQAIMEVDMSTTMLHHMQRTAETADSTLSAGQMITAQDTARTVLQGTDTTMLALVDMVITGGIADQNRHLQEATDHPPMQKGSHPMLKGLPHMQTGLHPTLTDRRHMQVAGYRLQSVQTDTKSQRISLYLLQNMLLLLMMHFFPLRHQLVGVSQAEEVI